MQEQLPSRATAWQVMSSSAWLSCMCCRASYLGDETAHLPCMHQGGLLWPQVIWIRGTVDVQNNKKGNKKGDTVRADFTAKCNDKLAMAELLKVCVSCVLVAFLAQHGANFGLSMQNMQRMELTHQF